METLNKNQQELLGAIDSQDNLTAIRILRKIFYEFTVKDVIAHCGETESRALLANLDKEYNTDIDKKVDNLNCAFLDSFGA